MITGLDQDRMAELVQRARSSGGEALGVRNRTQWNVAGNCSDPVYVELHTSEYSQVKPGCILANVNTAREKTRSMFIEMWTRCRKCDACRKAKAFHWRQRAVGELASATRTWFGTLTFNPHARFLNDCATRMRLHRRGVDFDDLSPSEQVRERTSEAGKEVTRWLKRVRKESGAKLRYCLVAEPHKSGDVHFHLLVHETCEWLAVKHELLKRQWKVGFTNFKLVKDNAQKTARYVAKYLAKSTAARVRASVGYGQSQTTSSDQVLSSSTERRVKKVDHLRRIQKFLGAEQGMQSGELSNELPQPAPERARAPDRRLSRTVGRIQRALSAGTDHSRAERCGGPFGHPEPVSAR